MIHIEPPDAPAWMAGTSSSTLLVLVANVALATAGTEDTVKLENVIGNRIALSVTSGNEVIEVFHAFDARDSAAARGVELRDWLQRSGITVKAVGFPVVRR